jgi:hypothetical protein
MALKAVKAEVIKAGKPKFLISGKSGVGKTFFALGFPDVYFIDTEGGATRSQYRERMVKAHAGYFGKEQGSQQFEAVIEEIKSLATTKHDYKTLVIDSFSYLYNLAAAIAEQKIGSDFGRDRKEANRPTRQLMRWLEELDMTVILICHAKDKWERAGKEIVYAGTTFDGYDKMEYSLDLWIEARKTGAERSFVVRKSRIDTFVEGEIYALDYGVFAKHYGADIIVSASKPMELASPEQVQRLTELVALLKIDSATTDKWLDKANADTFADMSAEVVEKCIASLEAQIVKIKGGK